MARYRILSSMLFFALALGACNLPVATQVPSGPDAVNTAAAQTVAAQLTQNPFPTQPLIIPTTGVPPSATTQPTSTTAPGQPSPTPICDVATFVSDVNYPDDTIVAPGQVFTKTWRLRNVGACSWTSGYQLAFDSGDRMNGPTSQQLTNSVVAPNSTLDISVNLTAPTSPGTYRGNWKLRNPSGQIFGLTNGGPFWVQVRVAAPTSTTSPSSTTVYSLYSNAPSADWISCGSPCGGGTILTFGGPDTDADGFAMYKDNALLEDGSSPNRILETHPMWVDNGVITGEFPAYTIQSGDHFVAKIGFLAKNDGTCGAGNVIFQFNYVQAGTVHPIDDWSKTCNGSLIDIDIDLSFLAGTNVNLVLGVLANGSSGQDWAIWVNPRIVR